MAWIAEDPRSKQFSLKKRSEPFWDDRWTCGLHEEPEIVCSVTYPGHASTYWEMQKWHLPNHSNFRLLVTRINYLWMFSAMILERQNDSLWFIICKLFSLESRRGDLPIVYMESPAHWHGLEKGFQPLFLTIRFFSLLTLFSVEGPIILINVFP